MSLFVGSRFASKDIFPDHLMSKSDSGDLMAAVAGIAVKLGWRSLDTDPESIHGNGDNSHDHNSTENQAEMGPEAGAAAAVTTVGGDPEQHEAAVTTTKRRRYRYGIDIVSGDECREKEKSIRKSR